MSRSDKTRFRQLLRGHALRELDPQQAAELDAAFRDDEERRREIDDFDRLHELLDAERALFVTTTAVADRSERGDPELALLQQAAARARDRLPAQVPVAPSSWPWSKVLVAAVLVAALTAAFGWWLQPPVDDGLTLGPQPTQMILIESQVGIDQPLAWHGVVGARGYEAVIHGADGAELARRAESRSAATRWTLTAEQWERVRQATGELSLRITALDGAGLPVGSTGDRPLSVRR